MKHLYKRILKTISTWKKNQNAYTKVEKTKEKKHTHTLYQKMQNHDDDAIHINFDTKTHKPILYHLPH
jgi:hypothetical protein